jgi:hypothetical protein
MMTDRQDIIELARVIEEFDTIEIASGDREPPTRLTATGKKWVVEGLRLLAQKGADDGGCQPAGDRRA